MLSVICIGGIGYYSITNLFELTDRVALLSKPNKKWELFGEITSKLRRLNQTFYAQGLNPSQILGEDHVALIDSIGNDINELRTNYSKEINPSKLAELDTIPILLEEIKVEFQELKRLQSEKQSEVLDDLEEALLSKLSNSSTKDSVHIIDRISLEVKNRNIPDSIFSFERDSGNQKRSFLRNLFSRAKPEEQNPKVVQPYKTVTDTLTNNTIDTVIVEMPAKPRSQAHLSNVIKDAFSNFYDKEMELMDRIREQEIQLYQKTAKITAGVERFINDLQFEENRQSVQQAEETVAFSKNFQYIIIGVLIFFAILSLWLVFMVGRDINKHKEHQRQILNNEEKAKREAKAKQEFLTTMSHELRTPLTSIIGYAELLDDSDAKAKSIKSSSAHLLNVANEILDSAKIESGIIEIKEESIDLTALLCQIRDNTMQMIIDAGLQPNFELSEIPLYVSTDAYRIQQILYNLIHNAIKFTYKGFVGLKVAVSENGEMYETKMDVSDSGIGIQVANMEKIFEDYQQIGTYKNKTQGIGLGLGLVKKVVQCLDGSISVTSKIGEGSTFHIFLPLRKSNAPVFNGSQEGVSKTLFRGKRIYCIDDDPLITKLYKIILQEYGAAVTTENQPLEALARLNTSGTHYDLVITDIKMPELTGYELLARLVKAGARPDKIIASTANVLLSEEDKQRLAQFDAYVSKPILKQDLLEAVSQVLDLPWHGAAEEKKEISGLPGNKFDIEDLIAFTMGDEDMLKEVLIDLTKGNATMLKEGMECLARQEYTDLGEIIHKLSSRFLQIKVREVIPVKELENALLNNEHKLKEAEELLIYWGEVNHQLENFVKEKFA